MNECSPFVSIVIPLYNAEEFIGDTLRSILQQTYKNFEVIVVDNGSTDASIRTVKGYMNVFTNLRVECLEKNSGGPALPRNIGISMARGKYIAFLDADDVWRPQKLEKQLQFMLENGYNFSSTAIARIDGENIPLKKNSDSVQRDTKVSQLSSEKIDFALFRANFITLSSCLVDKEILDRFSEQESHIGVEDYELWLNLIVKENCRYGMLPDVLVDYRVLNESISHSNRLKQSTKTLRVLSEFLVFHERGPAYYASLLFKSCKLYLKSITNNRS